MTSDAIVSCVSEPVHEPTRTAIVDLVVDHSRRVASATAGFRVYGWKWLLPWISYCLSPILRKLGGTAIGRFGLFNARFAECDLYTFANVFEDYPVREIEGALSDVRMIVDLGANVG